MSACILLPWRGDYKLIKNPGLFTEHTRSGAPRRGPASHDEGSFVTPAAKAPGVPHTTTRAGLRRCRVIFPARPAPTAQPLMGQTSFAPPRPELHALASVVSRRSEPALGGGSRGGGKGKGAPCSPRLGAP